MFSNGILVWVKDAAHCSNTFDDCHFEKWLEKVNCSLVVTVKGNHLPEIRGILLNSFCRCVFLLLLLSTSANRLVIHENVVPTNEIKMEYLTVVQMRYCQKVLFKFIGLRHFGILYHAGNNCTNWRISLHFATKFLKPKFSLAGWLTCCSSRKWPYIHNLCLAFK